LTKNRSSRRTSGPGEAATAIRLGLPGKPFSKRVLEGKQRLFLSAHQFCSRFSLEPIHQEGRKLSLPSLDCGGKIPG